MYSTLSIPQNSTTGLLETSLYTCIMDTTGTTYTCSTVAGTTCSVQTGSTIISCLKSREYRIAGKFGEVFNSAIW